MLRFEDLSPIWQEFYQDVVTLGFGELRDCVFVEDTDIQIGDVRPFTGPPHSKSVFNSHKPLSAQWIRFHHTTHLRPRVLVPDLKIADGEPVSFHTSEGGRRYKAGG